MSKQRYTFILCLILPLVFLNPVRSQTTDKDKFEKLRKEEVRKRIERLETKIKMERLPDELQQRIQEMKQTGRYLPKEKSQKPLTRVERENFLTLLKKRRNFVESNDGEFAELIKSLNLNDEMNQASSSESKAEKLEGNLVKRPEKTNRPMAMRDVRNYLKENPITKEKVEAEGVDLLDLHSQFYQNLAK